MLGEFLPADNVADCFQSVNRRQMRHSAIEAFANAAIGLIVSWCVTYFALPFWGLEPSPSAAVGITAFYFVVSWLRSFIIRECFRRAFRG